MFKTIKIHKSETIDLKTLSSDLLSAGYVRYPAINEEGDFAKRGSTIDLFPLGFELPIRIDCLAVPDEENQMVDRIHAIRTYNPATGDLLDEHLAVIILPIKGIARRKIKYDTEMAKQDPISSFVDISPGDFVVHVKHGIGIYRGVEHVKKRGRYNEHFVVEYLDNEKIYIPSNDIHLIQKYIGFESIKPKLHKIGGRVWIKECSKAAENVIKVAADMIKIQAKRLSVEGIAFNQENEWLKNIEDNFEHKETPDQLKAIDEVARDMEKALPMDRLICGDVGYGKTEVALRAAARAACHDKQTAILVPTTLLAEQHYITFRERFKDYPIRVELLSRFKTRKEQNCIVRDLEKGLVDIIIGTHRLVSKDVVFFDIGLLIIDEEQRFGVRVKERIKKLRNTVDVLTMTATPIPRTLYLSLLGTRNISVISTPPKNRRPIETNISHYSEEVIKMAIKREVSRGGQVFFIHNRIKDIERVANKIADIFPNIKIAVAHGKMKSAHLEATMINFVKGDIEVLVSTNIVESGIDMPNVNTIIINNADLFGLADLYQLRGRVGRLDRKAYCFLLFPSNKYIEQDAVRRMELIEEHTDLGSGFRIAMEDLSMRGAGNILGHKQHGFVNSIGFDMYCRLLKGAIDSVKEKSP